MIPKVTYANIPPKTDLESAALATEPAEGYLKEIDSLRISLPVAGVTTYTYKPLVGKTSETNPQGVKTTFEYDAHGRLQTVKDHNGKSIENYEYHYKNN
jgi:YD repeat-containing protein